jgi:hypothetical protein
MLRPVKTLAPHVRERLDRALCWAIAHPHLSIIESFVISLYFQAKLVGNILEIMFQPESMTRFEAWISLPAQTLLIIATFVSVRIVHGGDRSRTFVLSSIREPRTFFLIFYYFVSTRLKYSHEDLARSQKRFARTLANTKNFESDLQKILDQGQTCLKLVHQRSLTTLLGIDYPQLKKTLARLQSPVRSPQGHITNFSSPIDDEVIKEIDDSLVKPLAVFAPSYWAAVDNPMPGHIKFILGLALDTSYESAAITQ